MLTPDDIEMSAEMMSVTPCHADIVVADADVDMSEIVAENERKLQAMSEAEILCRQKELLSALGKLSHSTLLDLFMSNALKTVFYFYSYVIPILSRLVCLSSKLDSVSAADDGNIQLALCLVEAESCVFISAKLVLFY